MASRARILTPGSVYDPNLAGDGGGVSWMSDDDLVLVDDYPSPPLWASTVTQRTGTNGYDVLPGIPNTTTFMLIKKISEDLVFMHYYLSPNSTINRGATLLTIPESERIEASKTFFLQQFAGGAPLFRAELWAATGEIKTQWNILPSAYLHYIGPVSLSSAAGTPTRAFVIDGPGNPAPPPVRLVDDSAFFAVDQGDTVSYTTSSATGGIPPYIFAATGVPSWLTYNTTTRLLSGTAPNTPGNHVINLMVTDSIGETDTARVIIQVRS